MKVPFNGNVKTELLTRFYKDKIFYYVSSITGVELCDIQECKIKRSSDSLIVSFIGKDYGQYVSWENLFLDYEEAKKEMNYRNDLKTTGFFITPFVSLEKLKKNKKEMLFIEKKINEELKDFPNFLGIDFCDVNANGIQIRGHHKEIKKYVYGNQPTIKYDFSNYKEIIVEFVEMWKKLDNDKNIYEEKKYIRLGESNNWN